MKYFSMKNFIIFFFDIRYLLIPLRKLWRQFREKSRWSGGVKCWRILRGCWHSGGVWNTSPVSRHSGMKSWSFWNIPWKWLCSSWRSTARWRQGCFAINKIFKKYYWIWLIILDFFIFGKHNNFWINSLGIYNNIKFKQK